MQNLIKIKSASYKRYEELLYKKEALLKKAQEYRRQYEQIFDALTKEVYETRMDCVKKRKILSYCKSIAGQGKIIIKSNLDIFIEKAMRGYQDTLEYLSDDGSEPKNEIKSVSSPQKQKQIKATYHQLARLIHPDMNSKLKDDEIIQDLWNRTCIAHNCSNLEELEELSILINNYLESINHKHLDIEIPDINEKIFILNRQIYTITHTNPYQYKYVLENQERINRKKEELIKELNDYELYSKELDDEISVFDYLIEE